MYAISLFVRELAKRFSVLFNHVAGMSFTIGFFTDFEELFYGIDEIKNDHIKESIAYFRGMREQLWLIKNRWAALNT